MGLARSALVACSCNALQKSCANFWVPAVYQVSKTKQPMQSQATAFQSSGSPSCAATLISGQRSTCSCEVKVWKLALTCWCELGEPLLAFAATPFFLWPEVYVEIFSVRRRFGR